ncbi:MAG: exonuclease domain-containing protein [Planctomycetota bacterium JB042]
MFLVIDLEATCSPDGAFPREEMETIEIGAVLVDGDSLEAVDEFQSFVRPEVHPTLTEYCIELTSITQAEVDAAPSFPEAMARFAEWRDGRPACFSSWGRFDRSQFRRDCLRHGIDNPFADEHLDLKARFSEVHRKRHRYGMARALAMCGLSIEGNHHRGIDDARNIARMLPFIEGGRPLGG